MAFVLRLIAYLSIATAAVAQVPETRHAELASRTATAESRVALVIGNSTYVSGRLKNPVNDAEDIAAKLTGLGFYVIRRSDLATKQIGGTLREFGSRLSPGGVALVFYAGHGLQIRGENYLPTVDAEISTEEDVPNQSLAMRQIMDVLDQSKVRLSLIFLDACRDNPFARSFRSSAGGLAKVEAPSGTLISFATRPGSVASDGTGRNGLYTQHLLAAMDVPGEPVELALKRVVRGVKRDSNGKQEPWMEGSIEGDFYFRPTGYGTVTANIPPPPTPPSTYNKNWQQLPKNVDRDTENDPRKELQSIGVSWKEGSFVQAIRQGDLRAVELFVRAGMPLSRRVQNLQFPYLFMHNFDKRIFAALFDGKALDPALVCRVPPSTGVSGYMFYLQAKNDPDRLELLRKWCNTPPVLEKFDDGLQKLRVLKAQDEAQEAEKKKKPATANGPPNASVEMFASAMHSIYGNAAAAPNYGEELARWQEARNLLVSAHE
jgi:hypothetical protein